MAIVNIQIPLILGDVVNVVSHYTAENAGNFMEDMKKPAARIIGYYALQVENILCSGETELILASPIFSGHIF